MSDVEHRLNVVQDHDGIRVRFGPHTGGNDVPRIFQGLALGVGFVGVTLFFGVCMALGSAGVSALLALGLLIAIWTQFGLAAWFFLRHLEVAAPVVTTREVSCTSEEVLLTRYLGPVRLSRQRLALADVVRCEVIYRRKPELWVTCEGGEGWEVPLQADPNDLDWLAQVIDRAARHRREHPGEAVPLPEPLEQLRQMPEADRTP